MVTGKHGNPKRALDVTCLDATCENMTERMKVGVRTEKHIRTDRHQINQYSNRVYPSQLEQDMRFIEK